MLSTTVTGSDGVRDIGDVTDGSPSGTTSDVGTVGTGIVDTSAEAYVGITLNGGDRGIEYNFGEKCATIGDFVWFDDNDNGIQDPGETNGVAGVPVYLYEDGGDGIVNSGDETLIGITLTDATGHYGFEHLLAGDYYVWFDINNLPDLSYAISTNNTPFEPTDILDSDGDPLTGFTIMTTIDPGEDDPSWDLGISVPKDWGDLPDTNNGTSSLNYQTDGQNAGPSHSLTDSLWLGNSVDAEPDGQQDSTANGDDANGDDEDGITFSSTTRWVPGGRVMIPFSVFNNTGDQAELEIWIDWNGDGDFSDANEFVIDISDDGMANFGQNGFLTIPIPQGVLEIPQKLGQVV